MQRLQTRQIGDMMQTEASRFSSRAQEYHHNGYLVVKQLFTPSELQTIKTEMIEICRGNRGEIEGASRDQVSSDQEILQNYLCVHFPHKISKVVLDFAARHEPTTTVLREIIGENVKLIQTMMFLKGPGQPGQNWHQVC